MENETAGRLASLKLRSLISLFIWTFIFTMLRVYLDKLFIFEFELDVNRVLLGFCAKFIIIICAISTIQCLKIVNIKNFVIDCHTVIQIISESELSKIVRFLMLLGFSKFFKTTDKDHILFIFIFVIMVIVYVILFIKMRYIYIYN